MAEVREAKHQIKTVREGLTDALGQVEEYKGLQESAKELAVKRAEVKKLILADKDIQSVSSELEELKFKLKDLQEILSHHLVVHFSETQATEIKDADGETHQVVISAKIQ